jgi:alkylation response protein AidB-like acyl-CoA dehydrogenase
MAGLDAQTRKMILDTLEEFKKRNLPFKYLLELDQNMEFPTEIIRQMNDPQSFGLHLLLIEKEYGGLGGGSYDIYRLCESLARIDLGIATSVFATFLGADPIKVGGNEEQKAHWLGRIAKEGLLVAYGATEPEAGSDLAALKTKAIPIEEKGELKGYKISGRKQWISNGGVADVYTILANTPDGATWFIVEQETEGFESEEPEDKHGIRSSHTAALVLDEVFVPKENMIGDEAGRGLFQAQAVFGYTRLMVAALGLGAGWRAVEVATRYSQDRVVSGSALSEKQGYTHKLLVPWACRLEAARAYIEEIAERLDGEEEGLQTEGAIAKYMATESGNSAADAAIQALGGYGYTREFEVEKIKRDVKITTIYEGTSEIMEWTIARDRWQEHLKSKGQFYRDFAQQMMQLHEKDPDVGAGVNSIALNALSNIMEQCRAQRLTRNQHVLFRLGELIAFAETAMVFSKRAAAEEYTEAIKFDRDTWRAMARIFAREAAQKVVGDGIKIIIGSGQGDAAQMATEMGLTNILQWSQGWINDMDLVRASLIKTFEGQEMD